MKYFLQKKRLSQKKRYYFTYNLASMLKSHIPIVKALHILQKQEQSTTLQSILLHCIHVIGTGNPLSSAFSNFPHAFNSTYINILKAGEVSGKVDQALEQLANFEEKKLKLFSKITSALTYPIVVLIVSLLLCVFILFYILPKFQSLFEQLPTPTELPFLTSLFFSAAKNPISLLLALSIIFLICLLIKIVLFKNHSIKKRFHAFLLKLPFIGAPILQKNLFFFYKTLSTLLASGTPLLYAYTLSLSTINNHALMQSLLSIRQKIKDGIPFAKATYNNPYLPPVTSILLEIGEETSTLIPTLDHLADTLEFNFNHSITRLTSLLEPALLIALATVIGSIILSLFLPLSSLLQNFSY